MRLFLTSIKQNELVIKISQFVIALSITGLFIFLPGEAQSTGRNNFHPCIPIYGQGCPTPTPTPTPTLTPTPAPTVILTVQGSSQSQSQAQSQSVEANLQSTQAVTVNNPVGGPVAAVPPAPVQVAGVTTIKELPKTGLSALAWMALGMIPAGLGLRKFGSLKKEQSEDNPNYICENRKSKI